MCELKYLKFLKMHRVVITGCKFTDFRFIIHYFLFLFAVFFCLQHKLVHLGSYVYLVVHITKK